MINRREAIYDYKSFIELLSNRKAVINWNLAIARRESRRRKLEKKISNIEYLLAELDGFSEKRKAQSRFSIVRKRPSTATVTEYWDMFQLPNGRYLVPKKKI